MVEEKRAFIEYQIKEQIYNWPDASRAPRIVGKYDDSGERILPPSTGELRRRRHRARGRQALRSAWH